MHSAMRRAKRCQSIVLSAHLLVGVLANPWQCASAQSLSSGDKPAEVAGQQLCLTTVGETPATPPVPLLAEELHSPFDVRARITEASLNTLEILRLDCLLAVEQTKPRKHIAYRNLFVSNFYYWGEFMGMIINLIENYAYWYKPKAMPIWPQEMATNPTRQSNNPRIEALLSERSRMLISPFCRWDVNVLAT